MKTKFLIFLLVFAYGSLFSQNRSDSVHISHYDINLSTIDFSGKTLSGHTNIIAIMRFDSLQTIDFDLRSLHVDSVFVNSVKTTNYTHQNHKINIQLPDNLTNDTVFICIYYAGNPYSETMGGFYISDDFAYNMGIGINTYPHNLGCAWFPCIDEFTSKSSYTFRIHTPKGKMAVCGGLLVDSVWLTDSSRLWVWELNNPIPAYLASVATADYQAYKDTVHGLSHHFPIEIYATPSSLPWVESSFKNLKKFVHYLESKFGPYRWQRIGYVCVPFYSGAMEHACNIAYPIVAVNGSSTYEYLYFHELAHAWFGNLITCEKAEEMWINEGFARFSEILYRECQFPHSNESSLFVKDLTYKILLKTHENDGGFYALNQVPPQATYGSTSYDKGGIVVNALRYYMGDSLFFKSIRSLLEVYAYKNVNSEELITHLSQQSGMDLNPFYEAWIAQPGFLHFSIDSIVHTQQNQYNVFIRQRLYQAENIGNDNKIDLTFFSPTGEMHTVNALFSGEYGVINVDIPFQPDFGVIDFFEKMPNATIDTFLCIDKKIKISCKNANASVSATDIKDTVFMQVENHLAKPDELKSPHKNIYRISDTHYWRIAYTTSNSLQGSLFFNYDKRNIDNSLLNGYSSKDLILLYRINCSYNWQIVSSTQRGTETVGSLESTQILLGEYCLAIGDDSEVDIEQYADNIDFTVFPNPTKDYVYINAKVPFNQIQLTNIESKATLIFKNTTSPTRLHLDGLPKGLYILSIKQNNKIIKSIKLIKE